MDHPSSKMNPRSPVHFVVLAVLRGVRTWPIENGFPGLHHTTDDRPRMCDPKKSMVHLRSQHFDRATVVTIEPSEANNSID